MDKFHPTGEKRKTNGRSIALTRWLFILGEYHLCFGEKLYRSASITRSHWNSFFNLKTDTKMFCITKIRIWLPLFDFQIFPFQIFRSDIVLQVPWFSILSHYLCVLYYSCLKNFVFLLGKIIGIFRSVTVVFYVPLTTLPWEGFRF